MGINSCIFIDNSEIIILEHNIEWHILSNKLHGFYFPLDFDHVATIYFFIFCETLSIAGYFSFFDHLLEVTARFFGKKSRQVGVDSSGFPGVRENREKRDGIVIGGAHYAITFFSNAQISDSEKNRFTSTSADSTESEA